MLLIRGAMPFGLKPDLFESLFSATFDELGVPEQDVGLQFVSSTKMAQFNKRYAGKSSATDVLSFETDQQGSLGDIVICSRIAQAQAISHRVKPESEAGLLFVHGLLHLHGYDHGEGVGLAEMRRLQSAALSRCGLEAPSYP
jgi:probable rRNA maturation factor